MSAALSKVQIPSEIAARFADAFKQHQKPAAEFLPTEIPELDSFIGGIPRGAIVEIFGQSSSGRTSVLLSALAQATSHEEVCALIDTNDVFDPQSATQAGINFDRLLWVRCANNLEHAFKATDLLLQAGGFSLVALDLGDVPAKTAKRIISSWWYRFRRTLEATPTALVVIAEDSTVKSCAALTLELKKQNVVWSSAHDAVNDRPSRTVTRQHLFSVPSISIAPARRPSNRAALPHTNLLHELSFQIECHRPLFMQKNEDVLIRAAR